MGGDAETERRAEGLRVEGGGLDVGEPVPPRLIFATLRNIITELNVLSTENGAISALHDLRDRDEIVMRSGGGDRRGRQGDKAHTWLAARANPSRTLIIMMKNVLVARNIDLNFSQ